MQYITGEKSAVELEEYKGVYSLLDCYIGKDGVIKAAWGKRQLGKDRETGESKYAAKDLPIKVNLGTLDKAIQTVQGILNDLMSLADKNYVDKDSTSKDPLAGYEEIPF
jgi:hypothetical protein